MKSRNKNRASASTPAAGERAEKRSTTDSRAEKKRRSKAKPAGDQTQENGDERDIVPRRGGGASDSFVDADGKRWIVVADIARPHGVRGELRLRVRSGDPTLILSRPQIRLRDATGRTRDAHIDAARPVDRALLVELEGVVDRDAAEALRGVEVLVQRDHFPPLEEGEFYACDVVGARAELTSGQLVGTVAGLGTYPTCDVFLIDHDGVRLEVPNLPQFVESIDIAAGLVKLHTIEGLS
ncbi:MAG: 16S rRNA processing protein RimM [Polyangiaceae bacterium]|nr:16S rRNA processing protein RimM [Polyangiaceae bacterium]